MFSLPGVDKAVAQIEEKLRSSRPWLVALKGERGSGKSFAAAKLAASISAAHTPVVFISIPHQGDDAAAVALASAASQLDPTGSSLLPDIREPKTSWAKKIDLVTECLGRLEKPILIFDNPKLTYPRENEQTIFAVEAYELTQKLLALRTVHKVVTLAPSSPLVDAEEVKLETRSVPTEVLAPKRWDGLSADAAKLLQASESSQLEAYSPFELCLMVPLVASGTSPAEILTSGWHHRELLRRLLPPTAIHEDVKALRKVIGRLAVLRNGFDEAFLNSAGAHTLSENVSTILRRALLFKRADGLWTLHEFLAREAIDHDWLAADEAVAAHQLAARYQKALFEQAEKAANLGKALLHEMEYIHHLTEAGDAKTLLSKDFSIYFSEQYDALGKALSHKGKREAAVQAYERAIEHRPDDWYAHHYLAYNLDIDGREPDRVEEEYREALELNGDQAWFHGRLICFLITTGRLGDAKKAWGAALAQLVPSGSTDRDWVYKELHRQVVWLLLHRGQLDFAKRVLEDVPPSIRKTASWYQSFTRFMRTQEEAEQNKLVFPPNIAVEQRWEGPHLVVDRADADRVEDWTPGRIASIDEQGVHIRIAKRERNGKERYGWRDLTTEQLRQMAGSLTFPAGTFVELVTLRPLGKQKAKQERILNHVWTLTEDFSPEIFPPPDRYLRRGFTQPES